MQDMKSFSVNGKLLSGYNEVYSKRLGDLKILKEISSSSSDGELLKWQVEDSFGQIYWLKFSSIEHNGEEMYECESECIACRIAKMLGIDNVINYDMDELILNKRSWKVCLSIDFVEDNDIMTFAECVPDAAALYGADKYNAVISRLPEYREQLNKILIFDAIIFNRDRHLNNLALVGSKMVLFDNGTSMFSRDSSLKIAFNSSSFNYQRCKPFYSTTRNQLELVTNTFLERISLGEVKPIVERFLQRDRSKWVLKLLDRNLKEVERFWK